MYLMNNRADHVIPVNSASLYPRLTRLNTCIIEAAVMGVTVFMWGITAV